jgi:hypothetical protein
MKSAFLALVLAVGLQVPEAPAAEDEIARIREACMTVRRQLGPTCACFSEMARTELDDAEQSLLAAWLENDLEEAARLLRGEVTFDAAGTVAAFESSKLSFCSQYS